jgi:hypothetical protein
MKKFLLVYFSLLISVSSITKAQVLNVPQVIQEQTQWCWAGCSKCILDYYGNQNAQCTIAEYARTVITWTSFGTMDCCVDPSQGCNYWNYLWGSLGSIQDILIHFDSIQSYGINSTISQSQITTEISAGRPFVVRWGWASGGGHFVVGHGISGNDIYYMNPWFGEGLHVSTYNWLVTDSNHTWTHTEVLTTSPTSTGLNEQLSKANNIVYPNPAKDKIYITLNSNMEKDISVGISDVVGKSVYKSVFKNNFSSDKLTIPLDGFIDGVYFLRLQTVNGMEIHKVVIE